MGWGDSWARNGTRMGVIGGAGLYYHHLLYFTAMRWWITSPRAYALLSATHVIPK